MQNQLLPNSISTIQPLRALTILSVLITLGAARSTRAADSYYVNGLGTLGGNFSTPRKITDVDPRPLPALPARIVGTSADAAGDTHAFLIRVNDTLGAAHDLGTLGGARSSAYSVNTAGETVGWSLDAAGNKRAFRTAPTLAIAAGDDIGDLGGAASLAYGINDQGQVVGEAMTAGGQFHAFLTAPNANIAAGDDLGTLGGRNSAALAVTDTGIAVGGADTAAGDMHAFRTGANAAIAAGDDLGTLGGRGSLARAINVFGEVVGESSTAAGDTHAFKTKPFAAIAAADDLGTLGGRTAIAYDINYLGHVVGTSTTAAGDSHAFIYFDGAMKDLNDLIPPGSGWTLLEAYSINNCGQIVGVGDFGGQTLGFELDPTYSNQDSEKSFYRSGIVCRNPAAGALRGITVWDNEFARFVATGIAPGYNEIAFGLMECFGGGMFDELLDLQLTFASYASAACWTETSWCWDQDPASKKLSESLFNLRYAPPLSLARSHRDAYQSGHDNDLMGPVVNAGPANFPIEHPQYTSSGPIGDKILLHKKNPMNPSPNKKYLAILFGGNENVDCNFNSLTQIRKSLLKLGFNPKKEMWVMYPFTGGQPDNPAGQIQNWVNDDTTPKSLKEAWTKVIARHTTPDTQIYYWNSHSHGNLQFDILAWIKRKLGQLLRPAQPYQFPLSQSFIDLLRGVSAHFTNSPPSRPYLEIASPQIIQDLRVQLNGQLLSLVNTTDMFEEGSRQVYRFALSPEDVANLGATNSIQLEWSGPDPEFDYIDINCGDRFNAVGEDALPEAGVAPAVGLSITQSNQFVVLSWPAAAGRVQLQSSEDLSHPTWTSVPVATNNIVLLPASGPRRFFRLVQETSSPVDLGLTQSVVPATATISNELTYTITVTNGPTSASNVQVIDPLPEETLFLSANADHGICTESDGIVTCDIGTLLPNAVVTVTIRVMAIAPGEISNNPSVLSEENDLDWNNNTASTASTIANAASLK